MAGLEPGRGPRTEIRGPNTLIDSVVVRTILWAATTGLTRGSLVPRKSVTVGAIIGSTLMALSLVGSYRTPANTTERSDAARWTEVDQLVALGKTAYSEGRFQDARAAFW